MSKRVILKPGKEKSLQRKHPWIFSGAVASLPSGITPGELLPVYSDTEEWLALAYFHPGHSLFGRVLSFTPASISDVLTTKMQKAASLREKTVASSSTTGYRLIHAEGDGLPGLVVDRYGDVLVVQITTQGMERLRPLIIENLISLFSPRSIYEKSRGQGRIQEGLKEKEGLIDGSPVDVVEILENDLRFRVSLQHGQKTGFFFDQRDMRSWIATHAKDKKVLNAFAYSGGFSVAALSGGATHVDSVDVCSHAASLAKENIRLNGYEESRHTFYEEDVFDFIETRTLDTYDIIILDPPAFAKKRSDIDNACRGYKQLMRQVMRKAKKETILLTCSCSYHIDEALFQTISAQAASEAERHVRVLAHHHQALDHPYQLAHPEGRYLKSLFLYIE